MSSKDSISYDRAIYGTLYIDMTGRKKEILYYCLDDYYLGIILDAVNFEGDISIKFINEEIKKQITLKGGEKHTIPRLEPFIKIEID